MILGIVIPWPDNGFTCIGMITILLIVFRTFNSRVPMERPICHSKRSNWIGLICQDCRNVSRLSDFIRSNKIESSQSSCPENRVDKGWAASSHVIKSNWSWDPPKFEFQSWNYYEFLLRACHITLFPIGPWRICSFWGRIELQTGSKWPENELNLIWGRANLK